MQCLAVVRRGETPNRELAFPIASQRPSTERNHSFFLWLMVDGLNKNLEQKNDKFGNKTIFFVFISYERQFLFFRPETISVKDASSYSCESVLHQNFTAYNAKIMRFNFVLINQNKIFLYTVLRITPKSVTNLLSHSHVIAPGQHSSF